MFSRFVVRVVIVPIFATPIHFCVFALVVLTLLFLTPLFAPLPKSALAGVIIVVAFGLLVLGRVPPLAVVVLAAVGGAVLAGV